jgi:hypothetical protein
LSFPCITLISQLEIVPAISEDTVIQKTLGRILGCALLLYGSNALAFTLLPQLTPSTSVTDSFTLENQVQPIAGTIRGQILGHLRPRKSRRETQLGGMMFAANAYSGSSDITYVAAATDGPSGAGSGGSGGVGTTESLWISTTNDSLENTFSQTAFHGTTQNVMGGYDFTRSDKYVFGIAGGYEASNFTTKFNIGDQRTQGFNINPYFAWLLSDTWSLDFIGGYGMFNTDQSRTIGIGLFTTLAVNSKFSSTRSFASTNLSNVSTFGNWKLTGSLGYLWARRENDAYTENLGSGIDVAESKQTSKQWNLLGEVAYGSGNSESFFGARYEDILDYHKIEFASGEQPANDPTGVLLSAGWRHFGKDLTANFALNTRVAQEQVRGYGFAMLLRVNL